MGTPPVIKGVPDAALKAMTRQTRLVRRGRVCQRSGRGFVLRSALCCALCGAPFRCIGQAGFFDEIGANAVSEPNPVGNPHMAANLLRDHHGRFRYADDFRKPADTDVYAPRHGAPATVARRGLAMVRRGGWGLERGARIGGTVPPTGEVARRASRQGEAVVEQTGERTFRNRPAARCPG